MGLVDNTSARWSFGRIMSGIAPIRIAVPAWRMPRESNLSQATSSRISQAELMDLFQSELRATRQVEKRPDTDFTIAENMQRECLVRLRKALYAV
jgi:hypothetical protein